MNKTLVQEHFGKTAASYLTSTPHALGKSLQRLVDLTSHGPQRLFGITGKGRIAVGYDADLTVVDMQRRAVISNDWIASRCGWTPYDGVAVTGWPIGTIVRGRRVMWDGGLVAASSGQPVRFLEQKCP